MAEQLHCSEIHAKNIENMLSKLYISAHTLYRKAQNFGRENIGGLVIFSGLEIDQAYVLFECFSKTPYLL